MIITELRKRTGLSQKGFSEKFHIPKKTLQGWEQNLRVPPDYVLYMIEIILDMEDEHKA